MSSSNQFVELIMCLSMFLWNEGQILSFLEDIQISLDLYNSKLNIFE